MLRACRFKRRQPLNRAGSIAMQYPAESLNYKTET